MHPEISERVDRLNDDFERVQGYRFSHFYCPILLVDEETSLCRGHIIPQSTKGPGAWLPQREDVDNTLGAKLEEHLGRLDLRHASAEDLLLDKSLRKLFPPKIEIEGMQAPYYETQGIRRVAGHTPLIVETPDRVCNFNLKVAPELIMAANPTSAQLIADYDFSPAVWGAAIKAAHLTLFRILGYSYVFSSGGLFLANILQEVYSACRSSKTQFSLSNWMAKVANIVRPMRGDDRVRCTLTDGAMYVCQRATKGYFAIVVTVAFGKDSFAVFTPSGDGTIDTYFDFLQAPPPAVHVRECYFRSEAADEKHWEICGGGDPIRMPIVNAEDLPPSPPPSPVPPPPAS